MSSHALGFIDHNEILVLIQDSQRNCFRSGARHCRRDHYYRDLAPCLQAVTGFCRLTVHSYQACRDELLRPGTTKIGAQVADGHVQTFARLGGTHPEGADLRFLIQVKIFLPLTELSMPTKMPSSARHRRNKVTGT